MEPNQVPERFTEHVRDALQHLFDTAHLQVHPLLHDLVSPSIMDPKARAQVLRDAILRAISDLRPPASVPAASPAYRPYSILRHRYAEGLSTDEVIRELAISRRQFFREQQRACEAIATLLWQRRLEQPGGDLDSERELDSELEYLGVRNQPFALEGVARQALSAVRHLADSQGISLAFRLDSPLQVYADETITRQLLISLLRILVQHCSQHQLSIEGYRDGGSAAICFYGCHVKSGDTAVEEELSPVSRLAERVGGNIDLSHMTEAGNPLCLRLPLARDELIAVVDDNPKTLRLFERYLESYPYRVISIQDSSTALSQIYDEPPDIIILDVMMRDVDGWRLLQSLKTNPQTRQIPVLVCSVLNEEALALSIGADGYLRKPVTQAMLLEALSRVQHQPGGAPGRPATPSPANASAPQR